MQTFFKRKNNLVDLTDLKWWGFKHTEVTYSNHCIHLSTFIYQNGDTEWWQLYSKKLKRVRSWSVWEHNKGPARKRREADKQHQKVAEPKRKEDVTKLIEEKFDQLEKWLVLNLCNQENSFAAAIKGQYVLPNFQKILHNERVNEKEK